MVYHGILWYILWHIYGTLMYIAIMRSGSPPSREDPQLEVAFKVLVSQPEAPAQAMPEDGMKPLGASRIWILSHELSCVSSSFIRVRILSRRESGWKSSQDFNRWFWYFFILSYKSLKNSWQGGSFFAANNKSFGYLLQSDFLRGKKMGSDRTPSKWRTSGTASVW